jgi:DNA-directed RNA polymerase specialized sigma24 family protein
MANDAADELGKLSPLEFEELQLALARHAKDVSARVLPGKRWSSDALEQCVFDVIEKVLSGTRPWSKAAGHTLRQHLFMCVLSEVRNQAKKKVNASVDDVADADTAADEPSAEEALVNAERQKTIQDVVTELSKDNAVIRRVAELWLEGHDSPSEIAAITGFKRPDVNQALQTLRRRLRENASLKALHAS